MARTSGPAGKPDLSFLRGKAHALRRHMVEMASGPGQGYIGQGLGIADILAAVGPLTPFVFHAQVIVAILLVRRDVAVPLARETDHPIGHLEYLPRIVTLGILQPGRQAGQIPAVE